VGASFGSSSSGSASVAPGACVNHKCQLGTRFIPFLGHWEETAYTTRLAPRARACSLSRALFLLPLLFRETEARRRGRGGRKKRKRLYLTINR